MQSLREEEKQKGEVGDESLLSALINRPSSSFKSKFQIPSENRKLPWQLKVTRDSYPPNGGRSKDGEASERCALGIQY